MEHHSATFHLVSMAVLGMVSWVLMTCVRQSLLLVLIIINMRWLDCVQITCSVFAIPLYQLCQIPPFSYFRVASHTIGRLIDVCYYPRDASYRSDS
ncbi:hypothetical protein BKA60DRAFT_250119 [Fusarium oxysporum]|nr:hypothetical protein BKA60DRAFT_250119 [Fusarium oxysporum]